MLKSKYKQLKLDYTLPIIKIPENKVIPFIEWCQDDLLFGENRITEIPKVYNSGYILLPKLPAEPSKNSLFKMSNALAVKQLGVNVITGDMFKQLDKEREKMKKLVLQYCDIHFNNLILYYTFGENNLPYIEVYNYEEKELLYYIDLNKFNDNHATVLYNIDITPIFENKITADATRVLGPMLNVEMVKIFVSVFWYLTLNKKDKYETVMHSRNEIKKTVYKEELKEVKHPDKRVITTSFIDLGKAPKVKTETLVKKRQGFTYAHQFDVRGHYRHYKNGKVIFIESFSKAKDKPRLRQNITILNPKN